MKRKRRLSENGHSLADKAEVKRGRSHGQSKSHQRHRGRDRGRADVNPPLKGETTKN